MTPLPPTPLGLEPLGPSVLVTGAAHGFGRRIALRFAERGARVVGCDLLEDELRETARLATELPGEVLPVVADVTDPDAVDRAVALAEAAGGAVDVLVNNAGGVAGQVGRPLDEVPLDDWRALIDLNLSAAFVVARRCAPAMKTRRAGRIVVISSGAGLGVSLTGIQAYAAAKAGVIGLTRQLAHELGPYGITANAIAPGFVRSNPASERQWQAMGKAGQEALLASIATRRLGTPDDIAFATLFFASAAAGWISGQVLAVDGGR